MCYYNDRRLIITIKNYMEASINLYGALMYPGLTAQPSHCLMVYFFDINVSAKGLNFYSLANIFCALCLVI